MAQQGDDARLQSVALDQQATPPLDTINFEQPPQLYQPPQVRLTAFTLAREIETTRKDVDTSRQVAAASRQDIAVSLQNATQAYQDVLNGYSAH